VAEGEEPDASEDDDDDDDDESSADEEELKDAKRRRQNAAKKKGKEKKAKAPPVKRARTVNGEASMTAAKPTARPRKTAMKSRAATAAGEDVDGFYGRTTFLNFNSKSLLKYDNR
jgi:hypothetical protein